MLLNAISQYISRFIFLLLIWNNWNDSKWKEIKTNETKTTSNKIAATHKIDLNEKNYEKTSIYLSVYSLEIYNID